MTIALGLSYLATATPAPKEEGKRPLIYLSPLHHPPPPFEGITGAVIHPNREVWSACSLYQGNFQMCIFKYFPICHMILVQIHPTSQLNRELD